MGERVRLDRFLAEARIGTRAEVKKMIRAGRVQVTTESSEKNHSNDSKAPDQEHSETLRISEQAPGSRSNRITDTKSDRVTVTKSDWKVDSDVDKVWVDQRLVQRFTVPVLMLNKPAGVVSATQDNRDQTVLDLIHEPYAKELFPAGRLDRDTEGLLLLTSDGKMSHELLSPKKHVEKTYYVVIDGTPDPEMVERFREGLEIGEKKPTLPAGLVFLDTDQEASGEAITGTIESISAADLKRCGKEECCAIVTITEGKFHQIKRMFRAVGRQVHFLKRIAVGNLWLDPTLAPGQYRPLTEEELDLLKNSPLGQSLS